MTDHLEYAIAAARARLVRDVDQPETMMPASVSSVTDLPGKIRVFVLSLSTSPPMADMDVASYVADVVRRSPCPRPKFVHVASSVTASELVKRSWPDIAGMNRKVYTDFIFAWDASVGRWSKVTDVVKRLRDMIRQCLVPRAATLPPPPPAMMILAQPSAAATPSRPREESDKSCSFCTSSVPDEVDELDCGAVFCDECFRNFIKESIENKPQCHCRGHDRPHDIRMSSEMCERIGSRETVKRLHRTIIKKSNDKGMRPCPTCDQSLVLPLGADVYTCSATGCVNPRFGYCIKCDRGIKAVPHVCHDDAAEDILFREYMAANGVMPCPKCKQAAEKEEEWHCNHMHCLMCDAYFCGACGIEFPSGRTAGRVQTNHRCVVLNSRFRADENIREYYLRGSAP